jgi:hypothetical protein
MSVVASCDIICEELSYFIIHGFRVCEELGSASCCFVIELEAFFPNK